MNTQNSHIAAQNQMHKFFSILFGGSTKITLHGSPPYTPIKPNNEVDGPLHIKKKFYRRDQACASVATARVVIPVGQGIENLNGMGDGLLRAASNLLSAALKC